MEPEALLALSSIDRGFWQQHQRLGPFGIGQAAPVFWSRACRVQRSTLLRGGHLQLELSQGPARIRAMGWRWQGSAELPDHVDVAYRLVQDQWQGQERLQLELVGLRASQSDRAVVVLQRNQRTYWCQQDGDDLVVRNAAGDELRQPLAERLAGLAGSRGDGTAGHGQKPGVGGEQVGPRTHPYVQRLLDEAAVALGLAA